MDKFLMSDGFMQVDANLGQSQNQAKYYGIPGSNPAWDHDYIAYRSNKIQITNHNQQSWFDISSTNQFINKAGCSYKPKKANYTPIY